MSLTCMSTLTGLLRRSKKSYLDRLRRSDFVRLKRIAWPLSGQSSKPNKKLKTSRVEWPRKTMLRLKSSS